MLAVRRATKASKSSAVKSHSRTVAGSGSFDGIGERSGASGTATFMLEVRAKPATEARNERRFIGRVYDGRGFGTGRTVPGGRIGQTESVLSASSPSGFAVPQDRQDASNAVISFSVCSFVLP